MIRYARNRVQLIEIAGMQIISIFVFVPVPELHPVFLGSVFSQSVVSASLAT